MRSVTPLKEELELDQIRAAQQQLLQRQREFAESQRRIAREREESESLMPPLDDIQMRRVCKEHEESVSRGLISNARRTQNRSLLLLVLLVTATVTLVWWGLKLMQA